MHRNKLYLCCSVVLVAAFFSSCKSRFEKTEETLNEMTMSFITCGYTDDFLQFIGAQECDSYAHLHELLWIQKYNEISENEFYQGLGEFPLDKEEIVYFIHLHMINWMLLQGLEETREIEKYFKHKNTSPFSRRQIRNEKRFYASFKKSISEN